MLTGGGVCQRHVNISRGYQKGPEFVYEITTGLESSVSCFNSPNPPVLRLLSFLKLVNFRGVNFWLYGLTLIERGGELC